MSVLVLVEAPVKAEEISNMKSYLAEIFPSTRTYDGCKGIDAYFNMDKPDGLVLVERWDSRSHHEKYLGWRTETGVMAKLGSMLAGPPSIRYFDQVDG